MSNLCLQKTGLTLGSQKYFSNTNLALSINYLLLEIFVTYKVLERANDQ